MKLLIVDDDETFRERLAVSMQNRGYDVKTACDVENACIKAKEFHPDAAVVDLKMSGANGLSLISRLKEIRKDIRIVILTGYGSIASTLDAVRLGAIDYLTKPSDAGQIDAALHGHCEIEKKEMSVPSLDRVEWEHLQRVLTDCNHNISQAARILGIDRRSLQRKLAKYPPNR